MNKVQPSPPVCLTASEECTETNVYRQWQTEEKIVEAKNANDATEIKFPINCTQV